MPKEAGALLGLKVRSKLDTHNVDACKAKNMATEMRHCVLIFFVLSLTLKGQIS